MQFRLATVVCCFECSADLPKKPFLNVQLKSRIVQNQIIQNRDVFETILKNIKRYLKRTEIKINSENVMNTEL